MALKRLLAQRLFGKSRMITNTAATNCRVSSPCTAKAMNRQATSSDPSDVGIFRRYLHRHSGATSGAAAVRFLPTGETLLERIREMDIARSRPPSAKEKKEEKKEACNLTVKDAVKILKVSQLEFIKARLREIEKDHISYSEFVGVCSKECSTNDEAIEFAKMLDQSGSVIVLGNIVYIRPEQENEPNVWYPDLLKRDGELVVKAIQSLIPNNRPNPNVDSQLAEMEKEKAGIDEEARAMVQRELWCGLGCFVVQTAAFMRLTFWELSWDVMEPICFFVASMQFISGYAFFLRTSREPSFEGFYQSRFLAKQDRLIKARNFDIHKYNDLIKKRSASPSNNYCHHTTSSSPSPSPSPAMQ